MFIIATQLICVLAVEKNIIKINMVMIAVFDLTVYEKWLRSITLAFFLN